MVRRGKSIFGFRLVAYAFAAHISQIGCSQKRVLFERVLLLLIHGAAAWLYTKRKK